MCALSFGEALPILWRSGCCGPQCPSLPLRPVAEEHNWAKIKDFELGKIFRSGLRPLPASPLVLTPWVWTPDSEESEFLKKSQATALPHLPTTCHLLQLEMWTA